MKPPDGDVTIKFDLGGVALNKATTQVWMTFFSRTNREITDIPIPYYVFTGTNKSEARSMIETAWRQAAEFSSEKSFSRPSKKAVSEIHDALKELLEVK